jgi:hypothetical protein
MKKILTFVLVMFMLSGVAFASDSISKTVYSYGLKNTTGIMQVTTIPVTAIRPDIDKVIGYSIMPLTSATAECYIGIFDGTTNSLAGEVFAENEAISDKGISEIWPFGKYISEGVVVSQGANTQVQIYFVRE